MNQGTDLQHTLGWSALIREVPDFPQPGILFRDITPLLADAAAFSQMLERLAAPWLNGGVEIVCGIEARGFILGAALAHKLGAGFVPLRKSGKLPPPRIGVDYALEYGNDRLEARADTLRPDARTIIVDDVLATGGTLAAAIELVQVCGASLLGASVLIELDALRGRQRWLADIPLHAILHF